MPKYYKSFDFLTNTNLKRHDPQNVNFQNCVEYNDFPCFNGYKKASNFFPLNSKVVKWPFI